MKSDIVEKPTATQPSNSDWSTRYAAMDGQEWAALF